MGTGIILTALGFIASMLLLGCLLHWLKGPDYTPPKYLLIPIFISALLPGFLFGLWFLKKQLNKQYWQLTDTELICGTWQKQIFELASIEKIIVGRPIGVVGKVLERDKPGTAVSTGLDIISLFAPIWNFVRRVHLPLKKDSLVVCFNDGSWLPLNLYPVPNGAAIMNELKKRFEKRLVRHYNYSPEEIRRLRTRDINELIPARK